MILKYSSYLLLVCVSKSDLVATWWGYTDILPFSPTLSGSQPRQGKCPPPPLHNYTIHSV